MWRATRYCCTVLRHPVSSTRALALPRLSLSLSTRMQSYGAPGPLARPVRAGRPPANWLEEGRPRTHAPPARLGQCPRKQHQPPPALPGSARLAFAGRRATAREGWATSSIARALQGLCREAPGPAPSRGRVKSPTAPQARAAARSTASPRHLPRSSGTTGPPSASRSAPRPQAGRPASRYPQGSCQTWPRPGATIRSAGSPRPRRSLWALTTSATSASGPWLARRADTRAPGAALSTRPPIRPSTPGPTLPPAWWRPAPVRRLPNPRAGRPTGTLAFAGWAHSTRATTSGRRAAA